MFSNKKIVLHTLRICQKSIFIFSGHPKCIAYFQNIRSSIAKSQDTCLKYMHNIFVFKLFNDMLKLNISPTTLSNFFFSYFNKSIFIKEINYHLHIRPFLSGFCYVFFVCSVWTFFRTFFGMFTTSFCVFVKTNKKFVLHFCYAFNSIFLVFFLPIFYHLNKHTRKKREIEMYTYENKESCLV